MKFNFPGSNGTTLLPYKTSVLNTAFCWFQLNVNQEEILLKISAMIYFSIEDRILTPPNCLSSHFTREEKNKQAEEVWRVFHPPSTGHLSPPPSSGNNYSELVTTLHPERCTAPTAADWRGKLNPLLETEPSRKEFIYQVAWNSWIYYEFYSTF